MNKRIQSISATVVAIILLCSCNQATAQGSLLEEARGEDSAASIQAIPTKLLDVSTLFSSRDKEVGYEESSAIEIFLKDSSATCDSDKVSINGGTITISDEGTYVISGNLTNGQIIVDGEKTDKIQLVLNGATIHCDTSAPIYIRQGDKVFVTLANETQNAISNAKEFVAVDENSIDAVLFSKEDLTINGSGALAVTAVYGHGIISKDELAITGGNITVEAENHGISANDNICILDGNFQITAGKDGFHSENKEDTALGFIYIGGGNYRLNVKGDGLDAGAVLQVDNGAFQVTTTKSSEEAADTAPSTKGIKATGDVLLNGGSFTLDTYDDAIHTNGNLTINGGVYALMTEDDGIHGDKGVTITDGSISISKSYEGIEGETISIYNGEITIVSTDDGLNAAEKGEDTEEGTPLRGTTAIDTPPDFAATTLPPDIGTRQMPEIAMGQGGRGGGLGASQKCAIAISGGKVTIDADGDGIDSNGTLTMTGGEVYVAGSAAGMDSPLDCDGEATITGGTMVACGATGMFRGFSNTSTQGWIFYGLSAVQTGVISLKTGEKEVISFRPDKQYSCVSISAPSIEKGETYTLTMGEETQTITMESLSYSGGNTTSGFGGGRGGMGQGTKAERGALPNNNGSTQAQ